MLKKLFYGSIICAALYSKQLKAEEANIRTLGASQYSQVQGADQNDISNHKQARSLLAETDSNGISPQEKKRMMIQDTIDALSASINFRGKKAAGMLIVDPETEEIVFILKEEDGLITVEEYIGVAAAEARQKELGEYGL